MESNQRQTIERVIVEVSKYFQVENIFFAIGGSCLLLQHNIVDVANDIDIFVSSKDIKKIKGIMDEIAVALKPKSNPKFNSDYFFTYLYEGVTIDIVSEFKIFKDKEYHYLFDKNTTLEIKMINQINVPFMCLEDWVILYFLMDYPVGKQNKLIEYFKMHGIKHYDQFMKTLKLLNEKDKHYLINRLNVKERS